MNYDAAFVSFLRPQPTAEQLLAYANVTPTMAELTSSLGHLTPAIHFTGAWDTSADANMGIMSAAQEQVSKIYCHGNDEKNDNIAEQQPPPLVSFRPAEHILDAPNDSFVLSMDEIPGLISEKPIQCHLFYVADVTVVGWYSSNVVKTKYYLGYFTILPVESAFTNLKARIEIQARYISELENEGAGQLDQLSSLGHQFRAADNGLFETCNENQRLRWTLKEAECKIADQHHIINQKISDCNHLITDNGCLRSEAENHIKQIIALTAEVNQLKENRAKVLFSTPITYHDNYMIHPEPPKDQKPAVNTPSSLNPFGAMLASDLQNFNRGQLKSRTESNEREELRHQRRADLAARRELRAFAKLAEGQ